MIRDFILSNNYINNVHQVSEEKQKVSQNKAITHKQFVIQPFSNERYKIFRTLEQ